MSDRIDTERGLIVSGNESAEAALQRRNQLHLVIQTLHDDFQENIHWMHVQMGGRRVKVLLAYAGDEIMVRLGLYPQYTDIVREPDYVEVECRLIHSVTGHTVAVGQGSWGTEHLQKRERWDRNKARKMANKRARMDAVLSVGLLRSWNFTVDLEDIQPQLEQAVTPRPVPTIAPVQKQAKPNGYDFAGITKWFKTVIPELEEAQVRNALTAPNLSRPQIIAAIVQACVEHSKQAHCVDFLCAGDENLFNDVMGNLAAH